MIKTDNNWAKFWESKQNIEKSDCETSKLQPVNLSETPRDTGSVNQRVADPLQSFYYFSFCHNPTPHV